MLYYDIIDVCEGININNTNTRIECIIYHYWYFYIKDIGFS